MSLKNNLGIAAISLSALLGGFWLASTQLNSNTDVEQSTAPAIHGVVINPPRTIGIPELKKDDGQRLSVADFNGHWSLVFFGYTNCPDVCPTTLQVLKKSKQLAEKAAPAVIFPSVYFISVDPERDKAEVLAAYVDYFDKDFIGITGEEAMIKALTLQMSAVYLIMPPDDPDKPDNYIVDHSAALYLMNPAGKLAAMFNPPFTAQTLLDDIEKVITSR